MRIEDKLGETLRRATADEPLPADVWDGFQRRAHRAQRSRLIASASGLAVVIAVAAIVVPKLSSRPTRIPLLESPSPTPSASASVDPTADWKRYSNNSEGWSLKAPRGWDSMTFEGQTEFHPAGLSSLPKGEATFAVALTIRDEVWDKGEKCPSSVTCETDADKALFGGRHYTVVGAVNDLGGVTSTYRVDWGNDGTESHWTRADGQTVVARCSPASCITLEVLVMSTNKQLLDTYAGTGEEIVRSIEHL